MKTYQSWLLGALACATIVPFTGCTKDEMDGPNGGDGEKVETQLALVVTGQMGTKSAAEEMNNTFDGMTDIHLVSYQDNGTSEPNHYVTSSSTFVSDIVLADFNSFDKSGVGISNIKIYDNVNLPKEDVNFMFYAKSGYNGYATARNLDVEISTTNPAGTTFTLNKLTVDTEASGEITNMENYIDGVIEAAAAAINTAADEGLKTKFKNYVGNVTSPALYQVGYLMAQLYFDSDFEGISGGAWSAVKEKIANETGNFVFKSTTSTTLSGISNLMGLINTDNEKYLGVDFPVGGKTLSITVDYNGVDNSKATVSINKGTNEDKFMYPTPLYFMANTYPVVYDGEEIWTNLSSDFLGLSSNPDKIALKDQIEFAVGKFNLTFNVASNIQGNNPTTGYDHQFNSSDLEVVGILLNNQKQVGWDFLPAGNVDGVVYDNVVSSSDLGMLALATPKNEVVKFALEVKNKSTFDFKGVNGGIIPAGATFYLSGELDPAKGTAKGTGVDADNAPAAFSPDYETKVTVNLTSLAKAENTVPDLNAANLQLALSVDMEWKEGYSYTVEIGD